MKRLLLLILCLVLAGPAWAGSGHNKKQVTDIANSRAEANDDTTDKYGGGLGADVVVYENKDSVFEEVIAEGRHDFTNQETRVYGVVRFNLWKWIKGE